MQTLFSSVLWWESMTSHIQTHITATSPATSPATRAKQTSSLQCHGCLLFQPSCCFLFAVSSGVLTSHCSQMHSEPSHPKLFHPGPTPRPLRSLCLFLISEPNYCKYFSTLHSLSPFPVCCNASSTMITQLNCTKITKGFVFTKQNVYSKCPMGLTMWKNLVLVGFLVSETTKLSTGLQLYQNYLHCNLMDT